MSTYNVKVVHISIKCSPEQVYAFILDPEKFTEWGGSFTRSPIRKINNEWIVDTTEGPMKVSFAPKNEFGVADQYVTFEAKGHEDYNAVRVVPNGSGSEVSFMMFQHPSIKDEDFASDAAKVETDLKSLKKALENKYGHTSQ
ncbi:hypothetical protein SAMN05444392_11727 [Seinonella peptonophila]|uniref:Polyketide cyclase / dehydrase and lipid transport n=1 Tax=Seinonella peptonophila TaxID=112248 RepID=A0A1M5B1A6_9BACL|nr:SRPBCC family protein [Seinonella peptonophila]SHF36239.1 hypothetical protein SAMN05444392_11727 [Seinonella peptonophila]